MGMTWVSRVEDGCETEREGGGLELSVVAPCPNEARTVGRCIEKAIPAMRDGGVRGEVVGRWLPFGRVPTPGQWNLAGALFSLGHGVAAGAFLVGVLHRSRPAAEEREGEGEARFISRPHIDEPSASAWRVA